MQWTPPIQKWKIEMVCDFPPTFFEVNYKEEKEMSIEEEEDSGCWIDII